MHKQFNPHLQCLRCASIGAQKTKKPADEIHNANANPPENPQPPICAICYDDLFKSDANTGV